MIEMPTNTQPGWFNHTSTQRDVTSEVSVDLDGEMPIRLTFGPTISVTMSVGAAEKLVDQLKMAIRMKELQDSGEHDDDQGNSDRG